MLAAGCIHSLLTIRGRQFVPHRHPPSLQSFIPLHQLQHPTALVKKHPLQTVCFLPMHFPSSPMVYLLLLRRVYPEKFHINSPPPFSCCRKIKNMCCVYFVLAVYAFHSRSITFREQHSSLILTPDTTLHFHYKHTPQHRTA